MKRFFLLSLVLSTFQVQAVTTHPMMTVKERLRLSLWVEGLDEQAEKPHPHKLILPEEIERPLKKI